MKLNYYLYPEKLSSDKFYFHRKKGLGPIMPVNILLGPNNSGKSKFIREVILNQDLQLFSDPELNSVLRNVLDVLDVVVDRQLDWHLRVKDLKKLENSEFSSLIEIIGDEKNIVLQKRDMAEMKKTLADLGEGKFVNSDSLSELRSACKALIVVSNFSHEYSFRRNVNVMNAFDLLRSSWNQNWEWGANKIKEIISDLKHLCFLESRRIVSEQKYYLIPTRSLCFLGTKRERPQEYTRHLNRSFIERYRDMSFDENEVKIVSGQEIYGQVFYLSNSEYEKRQELRRFEKLCSTNFFNGEDVELRSFIGESNVTELLIKIGERETDITQIGDGIQASIILLFTMFFAPSESLIVIDEPETHLHPGFQKLLMKCILNDSTIRSKNHTIFLSTHSNHIIDVTLNLDSNSSIFRFAKKDDAGPKFEISKTSATDINLLQDIGVSPSSVFLSNCAIWVEGMSDVKICRKLIELYSASQGVSFIEDIDFCFILYGGSNWVQFDFSGNRTSGNLINAQSITQNILVLSDKDGSDKKKQNSFKNLKRKGIINYFETVGREIENDISPNVLKEFFLSRTTKSPAVKENWNSVTLDSYKGDYLGTFMRTNFSNTIPQPAESGTLNSKIKKELSSYINENLTFEQMSSSQKHLAKKLVNFIDGYKAN